jgi:Tfp pilus assembly protein PilE
MDKTVKVVVALVVLFAIGFLAYSQLSKSHRKEMEAKVAEQKALCDQYVADLQAAWAKCEAALDAQLQPQATLPEERMEEVFGNGDGLFKLSEDQVDCRLIDQQVTAIFAYLDKKGYLAARKFKGDMAAFVTGCLQRLTETQPIVIDEMGTIFRLLQNVTHLYRILGKERIGVALDILSNEKEIIEPAMAVLYAWLTTCREEGADSYKRPEMEVLYTYAGFFLDTLGGRSYLLRRDSKIRMLVNYYSLLLLDQANRKELNRFGIDIRPYIDFLFYDITNQKGIMYRERYLSVLAALQNRYHQDAPAE